MISLTASEMKDLSFPDFDVEKMDLSTEHKSLTIVVDGAWLAAEKGIELGRGSMHFDKWQNLSVNKFIYALNNWVKVSDLNIESLMDICDISFSNSSVSICGFSKIDGEWTRWTIENTNMRAEFETKA